MAITPATLIVVDDDPEICELLADYLGRHGYRVFTAEGAEALHVLRAEHTPDLLIVDLMLPGDDGFTICRDVRKHSDVPIIMLTASADETDRILGLELGADDYLGKPFNSRELLARIKAVLRRTRCAPPELPARQARWVSFGSWQLDRMTRELIDLQGERAALSGADFQLLQVFLAHPAKVPTRDDLYALTRGRDAPPLDRSIDVHVCRLRQRVAMGRALAREPKVYLFDEPLSNLDAKLRVDMRTEIKKLHQRLGTTIVYVTHDQVEAMTLADCIAVMRDGHILQLGTPDEVYNNPVDMFVAGFMGSPSMNFIRATLEDNHGGYQLRIA